MERLSLLHLLCRVFTIRELYIYQVPMDDGSTDATPQVLEALAATDARVRIHRRKNRGLIATLNEGLAMKPVLSRAACPT